MKYNAEREYSAEIADSTIKKGILVYKDIITQCKYF